VLRNYQQRIYTSVNLVICQVNLIIYLIIIIKKFKGIKASDGFGNSFSASLSRKPQTFQQQNKTQQQNVAGSGTQAKTAVQARFEYAYGKNKNKINY
jgi:hypothetical protein